MSTASSPTRNGSVNRLGWRVNNGTLLRDIRGSKHLLRVPPAISLDAAEYDRLRKTFDSLRVDDTENGWRYRMSAGVFDTHREMLDRGFGKQWFVRLERWTREPLPGFQLPLVLSPATT